MRVSIKWAWSASFVAVLFAGAILIWGVIRAENAERATEVAVLALAFGILPSLAARALEGFARH